MKLRKLCLVLLLTLPPVAAAQAPASQSSRAQAPAGQTAETILAKVYAARGGLDKLRAIESQRVLGHISFGKEEGEASFVVELKRPLKMHMELTADEKTLVRVYDGKSRGWQNNPFIGKTNTEAVSDEEIHQMAEEADFDGPLVDYKSKGSQVELVGKDKVDDKDVWRLKLTTKDGDVRHYFFDTHSFLLLKWEGKSNEHPIESFFLDYRDVDGVKFAFEVDSRTSVSPKDRKMIIDKIELNPTLDDSRFAKPPATEAPADPPSGSAPPDSR